MSLTEKQLTVDVNSNKQNIRIKPTSVYVMLNILTNTKAFAFCCILLVASVRVFEMYGVANDTTEVVMFQWRLMRNYCCIARQCV